MERGIIARAREQAKRPACVFVIKAFRAGVPGNLVLPSGPNVPVDVASAFCRSRQTYSNPETAPGAAN